MTSPDTEFIRILGASGGSSPARSSGKPLPDVLPVLGLSDIVIFPGMVAPLLVETVQSIRLIDDVVEGDRLLAVVLQKNAESQNPMPEEMWEHGCVARVLKMMKFPDNTVRILIEGLWRIRVRDYETLSPYLRAHVEVLKDELDESNELVALARNAHQQFQEIIKLSPSIPEQVKVAALNTDAPGNLSDLIATNLNLSLDERQYLIRQNNVKERLNNLRPLLTRELEVLSIGSKIQNEVTSSMAKSQRDFFLREQIRAIQRELGEADPVTTEVNALREQAEKASLPEDVQKVVAKELERLQQLTPAVAEYAITRNYLDWLIDLPWRRSTTDNLDLTAARKLLDQHHYGLEKIKERLIEFLAVIQLKKNLKGPILCLVGPPGVGKTSLGKSVADALGRKFARIALGGMRDEAEIRGHRRTYVGAMPGRIIQSLRRVGSNNPVVLLDELDKIGSDYRGDPAAALLEVLDPQQNKTFTDHYLDVPFDLSQVLFMATANWLDPVYPALVDRLEVIELPSYTASEKLFIARRHLVPRQLEEHGLEKGKMKLPEATLKRLMIDYTREAGVRQLEREIGSLARKSARRWVEGDRNGEPLTIQPGDLKEFLGLPKFAHESAERITEPGIATGLAWTPVGGEILFIEVTRMPGTGRLNLTGSLGDVMKESAQTALSYLRSQAKALALDLRDFDKFDLHLHVPAGATPKDGPSAGVTIAVAFASLLSHRKVKSDVAMTGEISLRGRVLRVGGIKEKVMAAARSGIRELILSNQNENDWLEVPEEIRKKMKVHFVKQIAEVLPRALVK
ncbi:MAG: endopeptidase La [Verrucomicrobia bacterium]|nr:endopeptidase La [Verrucomicrobiota bacterium]MBI3867476.1 endopeptidase La [Verrucomicrobiota bacterium]